MCAYAEVAGGGADLAGATGRGGGDGCLERSHGDVALEQRDPLVANGAAVGQDGPLPTNLTLHLPATAQATRQHNN